LGPDCEVVSKHAQPDNKAGAYFVSFQPYPIGFGVMGGINISYSVTAEFNSAADSAGHPIVVPQVENL
jgi:hypothetical protein